MLSTTLQQHALNQAITAAGVARRLQALTAAGWPRAQLAAMLEVQSRAMLTALFAGDERGAHLHVAVAALYARLADVEPANTSDSRSARGYARYQGWAPPAAWRQRKIDDPAGQPAAATEEAPALVASATLAGGSTAPERPGAGGHVQRLARRQWGGGGETVFGACRRLDVAPASLYVALRRLERLDVWARLTPWADAA